MKKTHDGYEIITKGIKEKFLVRSYYKGGVHEFEFGKSAHNLHDVLTWIHQHSTGLYATSIEDTLALGKQMLAPDAYNTAYVMAGQACQYVLRIASSYGYRLFTFEELYKQCPMLTEDMVKKAMNIGCIEGVYVRVRDNAWRLRKMSRLAERYENEAST